MSDEIYRPLIEDMIWSNARIECFQDCPYRWFLTYIRGEKGVPQFYSSYGIFIHKLIEKFYRGEITKEEMRLRFLYDFSNEVRGVRPKESTVVKYIQQGDEYLKSFEPFPFNMMEVEAKMEFELDGIPFVGIIDYIGEKDGDIYIVDNKSRDMKPRSNRKIPTAKDKELDDMLRQLYIYSAAIKQKYGKFPKALCFNCFRTGVFIKEPFDEQKYAETVEWVKKSIEEIKNVDDFYPNVDFFSCQYICNYYNDCCYWQGR